MIVQACLNGSRTIGFHQRLPVTSEDIVALAVGRVIPAYRSRFERHERSSRIDQSSPSG
jgi:hypothetical protein